MDDTTRAADLERIAAALREAGAMLMSFSSGTVPVHTKPGGSPVTDADFAVDDALRRILPRADEGWLSEESPDDRQRLHRRRVWIVDPLDGTREFLAGVPHWSVSIGLADHGVAVAGGIFNPVTDELFLGADNAGATLNGEPIHTRSHASLRGAVVVVSPWALRRRPARWRDAPFDVLPIGALAYTLAIIAAGRADATWSRSPKAEWDVAAGAAIITAAGGYARAWGGAPLTFNRWPPKTDGLVAASAALAPHLTRYLGQPRRV